MKSEKKSAVVLQLQNTSKFKDILISVRFLCPLSRKDALTRNILSAMIQDRSEKYDTKQKVTEALDDLYGASILSRTLTYGKAHMLEFRCKVLNEKFCTSAHLEKQFELVHQFLFHPLFIQESFQEAKDNLIDAIRRKMDKPSSYASNQALMMIGKDSPLLETCIPELEEIESITLDDIKNAWNTMMNNNHITVQVQGEIDKEVIRHYIHRFLPFQHCNDLCESEYLIHRTDVQEDSQTKAIDQTMLIMMFETGLKASHPDFWKLRCANALFGQLPTSLLFQEVREKRSLCYSISSSVLSFEGCMSISTGVSLERLEETKEVILKQFERMKQGDFSDQDLQTAKAMLKDSILSTADDMNAMLNFEYQNLLLHQERSIDDFIACIDSTQKEDIVSLFQQIKHRVTFVLKQEVSHEEDN